MLVCLVGALGKMGRTIAEIIEQEDEVHITYEVDPLINEGLHEKKSINGLDSAEIDVVINFTNPEATLESARWCAQHRVPLVTGTTGLSPAQQEELEKLSDDVPIVWASNMSLGVNLIDALLPKIAEVLEGFAVEIVEIHHDKKKDSPSGTAILFAQTLVEAKGGEIVFGRAKGKSDKRPITEVVVHAIRGGTVPGEHTIYFLGHDEVVEIKHRALSRKIFALGALKAVKWINDETPGLWSMKDVLDLEEF